MTKIDISPRYSEIKPQGFYVYLHRKATDGSVFYVGKGKGHRAWSRSGRSDWWVNISNKNGVVVEVCQDGMIEDMAFLLEMWLIAKLRFQGAGIVNISIGGEGSSGHISTSRKIVYCSNGMKFDSAQAASDWLVSQGNNNASYSSVSMCANGHISSSYGLGWSYNGYPCDPDCKVDRSYAMKQVYCSNGMMFESRAAAVDWLKSNGFKNASAPPIQQCCAGNIKSAYGFTWSDTEVTHEYIDPKKRSGDSKGKPVMRSDGMTFPSMSMAARYMGKPPGQIRKVCGGKGVTAHGYGWSLI